MLTSEMGVMKIYAVDGIISTRWSSQFVEPSWIYIDLGNDVEMIPSTALEPSKEFVSKLLTYTCLLIAKFWLFIPR